MERMKNASQKKAELWAHNGNRLPLLHANPRSRHITLPEILEVFIEEASR